MAFGGDPYIGKEIGGAYRITERINCGAFGCVYKAQHVFFEEDPLVAIKILQGLATSEEDRQHFIQEARLLRKLKHPHILPIHNVAMQDNVLFIVMEYAEGGSLKDRLKLHKGQPLPQEEALTILKQVGEALHYAHQHNVVHRDLKPDNILFNANGDALLADFGISAILSSGTTAMGRGGTPAYMSPEQFQGMVSSKSDQYALGCIAYELLTGHHPFDLKGASLEAAWYQHTKVTPDTPKKYNPRLSDNMAQAILTALAKDRTARYTDIPAFLAAISTQKTAQQWFAEGYDLVESGKYEEALVAYDRAIALNPTFAAAYFNKGCALDALKRYEEALTAYDRAIALNPTFALAYNNKGNTLNSLQRYDEALAAYDRAIALNPSFAAAYFNKGYTLNSLQRYEEALAAYDRAIALNPTFALAYNNKGNTLSRMGRKAEAERAYAKAKELGYKR